MKKLFLAVLFFPLIVFGQVDGNLKTLIASGTDSYTITEALPVAYDSKERFLVRFTNACITCASATLNRAGLGAKAIKNSDGTSLSSNAIATGETKLLSYNGTYYQIIGGSISGVSVGGDLSGILPNPTVIKLNGILLSGLGTGILKNTTGTGIPSIAIAGDFPTLNQNTIGSAATLTTGRTISITGDLAYTSPSFDGSGNVTATGTLATVNSNIGTFGSATQSLTTTVNGKGLITAISQQTVTPAVGSITGLGTGVATALGVNTGSAGAFTIFNGALGTPSSGTLTNATGLPPTTGISGWPSNSSGVLTNNGSGTLTWGAAGNTYTADESTLHLSGTQFSINSTYLSAADGSTKGSASFTAADFDAASGNISLDYTNSNIGNKFLATNSQTTNYILVLSDKDTKTIEFNTASNVNLTVPPNSSVAFPVGTLIETVPLSTGVITAVAGAGVTITATNTTLTSQAQGQPMYLYQRSTDNWELRNGFNINGQALTKTDDTNVTLTLGGSPTSSLLAATSFTLGWTGRLAYSRLTQGSALSVLGVTGNGAADNASITGTANQVLVVNSGGTAVNFGQVNLASASAVTGLLALANGGLNANLTASNGGIFYSTATACAILSGTATASKMLLSGATAAPTWSTSTIPTSAGATANKILLSDGTNYVLSTPTFPNASATSGKITKSDGTNWVASTETYAAPGTSGNIFKSDGTNWTSSTLVSANIAGVVGSTFEKAETGTDANVLTYTTNASTDEYLVVCVSTDVSALTGTSVVATVTWKDSNNATSTKSVTLTGVADDVINVPINAFKNTNVVVSTVFTGSSTAYNISTIITRLK